MTRSVAVIGAGAFGCAVAVALAKDRHRVTLFERRPGLLLGASYNNQNRLHLGFHYPRDLVTALQCKEGFARFVRTFHSCISTGFPNDYFIADHGSLTSADRYLHFLNEAGLPYRELDLALRREVRQCVLGVRSEEAVYDCAKLRLILQARLAASASLAIRTGVEIVDIVAVGRVHFLRDRESTKWGPFDVIVNCSYDEINRLTERLGHRVPDHQFEYTVIPIVALNIKRQGITIMDGPFMTLLPHGMSSDFLLYHVTSTVIATEFGPVRDKKWSDPATGPFADMDKIAYFDRIRGQCAEFVPALREATLRGFLEGPRMVLARREHDDARPSVVQDHGDGYLTVFAGKIDHCTWVADEVRAKIRSAGD